MNFAAILDLERALAIESCACLSEEEIKAFTPVAEAAGRCDLVGALDSILIQRAEARIINRQIEARQGATAP